jgi:hypothetical protein
MCRLLSFTVAGNPTSSRLGQGGQMNAIDSAPAWRDFKLKEPGRRLRPPFYLLVHVNVDRIASHLHTSSEINYTLHSRLWEFYISHSIIVCRAFSRQRLGNNVRAATDTYVTMEVLLATVFSSWSEQSNYKEYNRDNRVSSVWESARNSWVARVLSW